MQEKLLTKANVNDFLINCIGLDSDDVTIMPSYVKRQLTVDDLDLFEEYITQEE